MFCMRLIVWTVSVETKRFTLLSNTHAGLFQSFEIRGYILNNQGILIGLDSFYAPVTIVRAH